MQSELNSCYVTIRELRDKIFHTVPFSEQSLQNDQCVKFYTGLPSFRVLKAVFEFVAPPTEFFNRNPTKLTDFQELWLSLGLTALCRSLLTNLEYPCLQLHVFY